MLSRLRIASLRQLPSGIFSIVMATGIVAIAVDELALTVLAKIVFALAVLAYVLLWMLFALRLWRYWHDVRDDARHSERALGFFAIVAATSVVGTALAGSFGIPAALPLWLATLALWFAITYTILPGLMIARDKSSFGSGFNGVWLLVVVATESVAVLGAPVAAEGHAISATLEMFTALCFWLVGGMLYLWLIALIFYRCIFLPMSVEDVTPTYWINMGAMSIATLAGTSLLHESNAFVQLHTIAPFIAGITLGFWATATWWIPILLVLGFWRHVDAIPVALRAGKLERGVSDRNVCGRNAQHCWRTWSALRRPDRRSVRMARPVRMGGERRGTLVAARVRPARARTAVVRVTER